MGEGGGGYIFWPYPVYNVYPCKTAVIMSVCNLEKMNLFSMTNLHENDLPVHFAISMRVFSLGPGQNSLLGKS